MADVPCVDCRESILNAQSSQIGLPNCADPCTTESDCNGQLIPSNCVFSNAALPCIGTTVGTILTDILIATDIKLCQIKESTGTSNVTANDTCYGFLGAKIIAGDGIVTTVINPGACEKLQISEKCWEWNPVIFKPGTKWKNIYPTIDPTNHFQTAEYSNVKECSVRLRGAITNTSAALESVIFILPAGKRPQYIRTFSVNVISGASFLPGFLYIQPTGEVSLVFNSPGGSGTISFDNIQFEVAPN